MRMDKPVRIASMVILAIVIVGAVISNRELFFDEPRRARRHHRAVLRSQPDDRVLRARGCSASSARQAVASAFEIGIHNATLAIVIAQTVLGSEQM